MILYMAGLSLALAMDCFAVALGISCGASGLRLKPSLRLALFFGSFQFIMAVLGWLVGEKIVRMIEHVDHWVGFGLLLLVGGKMIMESFKKKDDDACSADQTQGWRLLVLSVATSIDSLAVGLSLGVIGLPVMKTAAIIGAGSFLMTLVGARLGFLVSKALGKKAELVGGVILIIIGIKIIIDHAIGN